jgi:hypothetical protein
MPLPTALFEEVKWQNENCSSDKPACKRGYGDKFLPRLGN